MTLKQDNLNRPEQPPMKSQPESQPDERGLLSDAGHRDLRKSFARLLSHPDAAAVLSHLHRITRNRLHAPDVSEAVLRHMEGQKALIAYMERMAQEGRVSGDAGAVTQHHIQE